MGKLIAIIPVLPLFSALLTHIFADRMGQKVAHLSVALIGGTFVLTVLALWMVVTTEGPHQISFNDRWGILLSDPLSALMGLLIAGISFIVHVYSLRYMVEEQGYTRFFVLLGVITSALLLMVCAGDLVTLMIAWHLVSVSLYFLLGHQTSSASAYRYAFWTFLTYRVGDLALVLAAGLLYQAYGTWSIGDIFTHFLADPHASTSFGFPLAETVAGLLAFAAFARSAQFLMHIWLPYTMDGPTPVSALMHAGIVNAGGFLINRFAPIFAHSGDVLQWVFIVGLITAVIGSILMLTQNDIKKALGYSTMGQMGFMIMECGVGAFSLAIYHLIAHGIFKGTLFLSAGSVISDARKEDGVPKDSLYTFVVERRSARRRQPWLLMAAITLAVPAFVLVLTHWLVSQDFFQKQGAIILLFFGWVTGAQLIFATFRMQTENVTRLFTLVLFSFTVVVIGYTLISHAFDLFLYPDAQFRTLLYSASSFNVIWFDILVVLTTVVIVLGWLLTYYSEQNGKRADKHWSHWRLSIYALISREFYLADLYAWLTRVILRAAARLNVLLRWA